MESGANDRTKGILWRQDVQYTNVIGGKAVESDYRTNPILRYLVIDKGGLVTTGRAYETRLRFIAYETDLIDELRRHHARRFHGGGQTGFWGQWGSTITPLPF